MDEPETVNENSAADKFYQHIEKLNNHHTVRDAEVEVSPRSDLLLAGFLLPVGYLACTVELSLAIALLLSVAMCVLSLHTILNCFSVRRLGYAWCISSLFCLVITFQGQGLQSLCVIITGIGSLLVAAFYRRYFYLAHSSALDLRYPISILELFAYSAAFAFYFYIFKTKTMPYDILSEPTIICISLMPIVYSIILVQFLRGISYWNLNVSWYLLVSLPFVIMDLKLDAHPFVLAIYLISLTAIISVRFYYQSNFFALSVGSVVMLFLVGILRLTSNGFSGQSSLISSIFLIVFVISVIFGLYLVLANYYISSIRADHSYLMPFAKGRPRKLHIKSDPNKDVGPLDAEFDA